MFVGVISPLCMAFAQSSYVFFLKLHSVQKPNARNHEPSLDRRFNHRGSKQKFFIALSIHSYSRCIARSSIFLPSLLPSDTPDCGPSQMTLSWIRSRPPRSLRCTRLESIFELARHFLHGAHAAGTGRLSSLSFHAPVVCKTQIRA